MNRQDKFITIPSEQRERLCSLIAALKEEESIELLKELHEQGGSVTELLALCMEGVQRIGSIFESGKYYISALIMASEIMRQASEYLSQYLPVMGDRKIHGTVLIGTIEGDTHDLGKNIFKNLLKCNNFQVIDLGVDVPAEMFIEQAIKLKPDIVAISCLLTHSIKDLKATVKRIKDHPSCRSSMVLIGGSCIDDVINEFVRADNWFNDAFKGVAFCQEVVRRSSAK